MTRTADLLVVGAGTAGMACAITAADAGAHVVVLETSDRVGGSLYYSGGHMSAGGTRRQRERGIDDSPDHHFADVMRISRGTADAEIVRLAVDEAPGTVEWLETIGLELADETPIVWYGHEPYDRPRTVWGANRGCSILRALRGPWDAHAAAGRIALLTRSPVRELLTEGGRVAGAAADAAEVRTTATVLATGGYAANLDLLAEVTPGAPRVLTAAAPTSQGDGIAVARRAGARFHRAERFLPSIGSFAADAAAGRAYDSPEFMNLARMPREIWVNAAGERFTPEDVQSPDSHERALADQPGAQLWVVLDERALSDPADTFHRTWDASRLRAEAADGEIGWSAATPRELAGLAGIDPDGLERTIASWNDSVATGRDPLGRTSLGPPLAEPPFYAFRSDPTVFVSFGGLAVDRELRVLDDSGRAVDGLYAAGEIIGAGTTSGNAFCSGMVLTPALAFGRLLGRRLTDADDRRS